MDGVVRHIEVEGLVVGFRFVQCLERLLRQCFGQEGPALPIVAQSRYGERRGSIALGIISIVAFAQVSSRSARCMACNVHLESEVMRVLSRRIDGAPMSLAAMDGMIPCAAQQFDEGGPDESILSAGHLGYSVDVPLREEQPFVSAVGRLVPPQCPVGHPMAGSVATRHQTAAGGRADTAGISVAEEHPFLRQTFHVGRFVAFVVIGLFRPERHGCILPSHIIDKEEDDIGTLRLWLRRGCQRGEQEGGE